MRRTIIDVLAQKGEIVHVVSPETSLTEAVRLMNEHRVGALVVMDERQPVGIISERDVLMQLVDAHGDAAERTVATAIRLPPLLVGPDVPVEEAVWVMTRRRSRHLIVCSNDELLGLISLGDLARTLVESAPRPGVRRARDSEVAEALAEESVRRRKS